MRMGNNLSNETMIQRMYTEMIGLDGDGGIVKDIRIAKDSRKELHKQ